MKRIYPFFFVMLLCLVGCADDESFTTSGGKHLTFPADTLEMDTVFSRVPSSTYTFWVHNDNDEGLRLTKVRLSRGNQTGFRVNVDGLYLDNTLGSQVNDLEVRSGDSLLVFVELTAPETSQRDPKLVEDDLVFTLESGTEQRVNLRAWAWDAQHLYDPVISRDTVITTDAPIIIYGTLTVAEGVTLTLKGSTLYLHDQAGIDVKGTLRAEGCLLRGDRLDHMFDYLPYDRVSGQWRGITFSGTSTGNVLTDTELRNACDAIVCDSASLDSLHPRLTMTRCIVHNSKGVGVKATNSFISLDHCQLSNTLGDCLNIVGGICDIHCCTLAQFYPFTAPRGAAINFSNYLDETDIPLLRLWCDSTIITGYDEDVLLGSIRDTVAAFNFHFDRSLLRTPKVETDDSVRFSRVIWESPTDSIEGKKHFRLVDEENLNYDFHLDSLSTAWGLGAY
ncbi:MAG: right-handed parallel beta-helix repeat-containing protein [Prevotella sp.]|nr:right-handed parallel beta-helix repeat-containing protein [Prevotella sp.]